jgi:hypothetical protein
MASIGQMLRAVLRKICQRRHDASEVGDCAYMVKASSYLNKPEGNGNDASGIVFSMDRAMQLDALLGSYRDNVTNAPKLTVIFRATSERHQRAYETVFAEYSDVVLKALRQHTRESFRAMVIAALGDSQADKAFFLVDDDLFIEKLDIGWFSGYATSFAIPTLRLGDNLNRSYTVQSDQRKPAFLNCTEATNVDSSVLLSWLWGGGELDWGYPLSVDGHIFLRNEMLAMAQAIKFDSPNTFEAALQAFTPAYRWRIGICYEKSRLLNIPYNKVQTDFKNIHGEVHQDEMLQLWNDGFRIDRASYYGMTNVSAHQEMPLRVAKADLK